MPCLSPCPRVHAHAQVAGSTVIDALWRNVNTCNAGGLKGAWRESLCGEYDTHKNLMFVRNGLPRCTRTPTFVVVVVFRRPLDKLVSTLYWYPPLRLRRGPPWTTHIRNWTAGDLRYMLSMLSVDRNPALQPPLQEYTAVLGGAAAHSSAPERKRFSGTGSGSALDGANAFGYPASESRSDPMARNAAIHRLKHDPTLVSDEKVDGCGRVSHATTSAVLRRLVLESAGITKRAPLLGLLEGPHSTGVVRALCGQVVGLTERLNAAMVLIALRLGWPTSRMAYTSMKSTTGLPPSDPRYNVNRSDFEEKKGVQRARPRS